jgi:gluconokinase
MKAPVRRSGGPEVKKSTVLALDLGTSSVRAALFDARGRRIDDTTTQRAYPLLTSGDGRAELDPETVLAALLECIAGTLAAREADAGLRRRPIAAVGGSCFWHSLIGIDGGGRPVTPIITWADSRCRDDAAALRRRLDERAVHARTGCMLRPSFWPAKLAHLRRTAPGAWKRARWWLSPAEWLWLRLTGSAVMGHSMASATGCYATAGRTWDARLLRALHLDADRLPTIADAPLLPVEGLAARFPALAGARWFPALGDGAASNLGAGATGPGAAAINFGTSGAVRIVRADAAARPQAPFGLFCYRIDAARHLVGGAISNAGGLRAWCLQHLRLPDEAELERLLARRPGPAPGLAVLPFWMAERAPTWRDDLSGSITGITQATGAVDLLHAITEATYQRLATILARIPGDTRRLRVVVGGGIQKSPSAFQRLADVTGRTLVACDDPETSLRGAAVFALEGLGLAPAAIGGRTVRPRARWAAAYAAQRIRLAQLEATLHPD